MTGSVRRLRQLVVLVLAVFVLGSAIAHGGDVAGAVDGPRAAPAATTRQSGGDVCARLERRVAEVPALRRRVRGQLAELEARIAAALGHLRRARLERRLQPRIERLEQLDRRLGAYVTDVAARCGARPT